jgi:hypothetical protein
MVDNPLEFTLDRRRGEGQSKYSGDDRSLLVLEVPDPGWGIASV